MSYPEFVSRCGRGVLRALRRHGGRDLYWSVYEPRNFGDWIGPYLFEKITGMAPRLAYPNTRSLTTVYVAVGSIMRRVQGENAIVWGSGIISREDSFLPPAKTCAVRGPLTRARFLELGYACPAVYGDPAILMPAVYRPRPSRSRHRLGIVPHFIHYAEASERFAGDSSVRVVDVTQPVEDVVDAICSCTSVASSSLHGIIVANAYGIPAAWISFRDELDGDGTKFRDYYAAGGVIEPHGPLEITSDTSLRDIEDLADQTEQPDLSRLLMPLMKSCPFRSDWFAG